MASAYLGPESPRPLAVISEGYRGQVEGRLPALDAWDRYSLGPEYEERLFGLLHKYLELGTTDTLCYVGDTRNGLHHRLEDRFCLQQPVMTLLPGHVHYAETPEHRMLPIPLSHVGAEEHFRQLAQQHGGQEEEEARGEGSAPVFDRVLLNDACRYLTQPAALFRDVARCLAPGGIVLVLHRAAGLSTLPIFADARQRLAEHDVKYMDVINALQRAKLDVQWQLEAIPVRMSKRKWLAMMTAHYPPDLEMMSHTEILSGLRELTEGVFKYEGETVEFQDRLLFIKATHSDPKNGYPSVQRYGNTVFQPVPEQRQLKLTLAMPVINTKQRGSPPQRHP